MNVLMVSHYFESHRGGVEIVAGQLARALTTLGHQVAWMAADSNAPPTDPDICHHTVPIRASNTVEQLTGLPYPVPLPRSIRAFRQEIRGADVILLHDGAYAACQLALLGARWSGVPVVLIQHIGAIPYRSAMLRLAMRMLNMLLTKPALARADQVVFISELTRDYFAAVNLRRPPKVMFNGVDVHTFAPPISQLDRKALRTSLGLDRDRPIVLFVGRFVEKKGLHHIEAMARRRPDWQWVLAGWGGINPANWHLSNVHVYSDRSGPSLTPLYHAADALVLPSIGEGFPLVVQEALACGLPVVCGQDTARADSSAARFLNGVPVLPEPQATADAFMYQLAVVFEEEAIDGRREDRSRFARERYSWPAMAGQLSEVFKTLPGMAKPFATAPVSARI